MKIEPTPTQQALVKAVLEEPLATDIRAVGTLWRATREHFTVFKDDNDVTEADGVMLSHPDHRSVFVPRDQASEFIKNGDYRNFDPENDVISVDQTDN